MEGFVLRPASAASVSVNRLAFLLLSLTLAIGLRGQDPKAAPERTLLSVRRNPDETTHTRFQRRHQGVRVWGGDGILHARKGGQAYLVTDPVADDISISTSPSLSPSEARSIMAAHLRARGPFAREPKVELVILPELERVHRQSGVPIRGGESLNAIDVTERPVGYRLAYYLEAALSNDLDGTRMAGYLVEAHGGAILHSWNALQHASGTGNSQYNGTVILSTAPAGTGFELRDLSRGGNQTLDLNHDSDLASPGTLYADADNLWGDGLQYVAGGSTVSANGQTAAVDAHFGTQATWDFYGQVLGRNGIDGKGTPTRTRVHFSNAYDNAFWWDECFCLTFGDGNKFKTLTPLDVVGHEFSHGVTATTAGLIYMGESGSLNEATSDIFGSMIVFYVRGANGTGSVVPETGGDWTIGEQMQTPAFDRPLRYMIKPSLDGASADAWSTGLSSLNVHYGSGPMNRCFYFLAQGASPDAAALAYSSFLPAGMAGLGNDKATRIWYRALTTYLTSASGYLHARMAALRAASDLYGLASSEVQAVRNAFAAINVGLSSGAGDDLEPPTVIASVNGTTGIITLAATAHDNTSLASIGFYVDQQRVGVQNGGGVKDTTVTLAFDSSQIPKGSHILTASATDAVGNVTHSAQVPFLVSNSFYELLLQGDFEYGSPWDGGIDKSHMAWVDPQGVITDGWPYLGRWCADFCGVGAANTQSIWQTVTIPSEARNAILTFWLQIFSQEPDDRARDTFQVQVRSIAGNLIEVLATYSNLDRSRIPINVPLQKDYTQRTIDLSAYRGRTIQLCFVGQEDAAHPTAVGLPGAQVVGPAAILPFPGRDPALVPQTRSQGVTSYPVGVGLTEFLLDNVSLRIGEATDTETPVVTQGNSLGTYGTLTLAADASDNLAVTRVDYLVDGKVVGTTTAGPHRIPFDSRILLDGPHQLVMNAYDPGGNKGASYIIAFRTDNTLSQLLVNPGFDFGTSGWIVNNWDIAWLSSNTSTSVTTLLFNRGFSTAQLPATLTQRVAIPANAYSAKLLFPFSLVSLSNPPDDALMVQVWDLAGVSKTTLASYSPPGTDPFYGNAEVDLMAYRGQDIQVALVLNTLFFPSGGAAKGLSVDLDKVELVVQTALAPTIHTQPVSQSVPTGQPASLSVGVSGTAPLAFQWRKNGIDLPGANLSTFALGFVQPADAGSYDARVTNSLGNALSQAAVLTVLAPLIPPTITVQPLSRSVTVGSPVTFSVTASGSAPFSYQWRKNDVATAGATEATLTFTPTYAYNGSRFSVAVSNGAGNALSANATLTVTPKSQDLNGDGAVNVLDLATLIRSHAPGLLVTDSPADLNGDGFVDDADLALLLAGL